MLSEELIAAFFILECKPDATFAEVKKSYRELVNVWHPDRFNGTANLHSRATEKLKLINQAYELLEGYFRKVETEQSEEPCDGKSRNAAHTKQGTGFEIGKEEVNISRMLDKQSNQYHYVKERSVITAYNGRWVSKQRIVFATTPIRNNEPFELLSKDSMSFYMKGEQGKCISTWDYGSQLAKSEHMGSGSKYVFSDGSWCSVDNVSTDTWFHDEHKIVQNAKTSTNLNDLEEAYNLLKIRSDWKTCIEIAERAVMLDKFNSWGWIQRSFALHVLGYTKQAYQMLAPAAEIFPAEKTVFYNLACYSAKLGNKSQATIWLQKVFTLAKNDGPYSNAFERYRKMASNDSDLDLIKDTIPSPPLAWKFRRHLGF